MNKNEVFHPVRTSHITRLLGKSRSLDVDVAIIHVLGPRSPGSPTLFLPSRGLTGSDEPPYSNVPSKLQVRVGIYHDKAYGPDV